MAGDTHTLYEWAGGNDLLEPIFRGVDRDHPKHVAAWLAEVFGGPARPYTG
jgi:hemoglobin